MEVDTATDAGLAKLDAHLLDNSYISGYVAACVRARSLACFVGVLALRERGSRRVYLHFSNFPGSFTVVLAANESSD